MGAPSGNRKCDCIRRNVFYIFISVCAVVYLNVALVGLSDKNTKVLYGIRNSTLSFLNSHLPSQRVQLYGGRTSSEIEKSNSSTADVVSKDSKNSTGNAKSAQKTPLAIKAKPQKDKKSTASEQKKTKAKNSKKPGGPNETRSRLDNKTTTVSTTLTVSTNSTSSTLSTVSKASTTSNLSTLSTTSKLLITSTVAMASTIPTPSTTESDIEANAKSQKGKKTDGIIMQYRVEAETNYQKLLDKSNVPQNVRKGNAILRTRTYPTTPRKTKCNKCFTYVYNTVIKPNSCDAPGDVKVLAVITTVPWVTEIRDALRQTWLSVTKNNTASVRYVFLLGSGWPADKQAKLKEESEEYKDILQDDYIDSYFNLSIKALSGFKYGLTTCKRAQFIMRSADDNYVNLPNILQLIKTGKKVQTHMFGPCVPPGSVVIRGAGSKWAVTRNEWQPRTYPAYCVGTTFLMSHAVARKLYLASENVPYFVMEDVYFGEVAHQSGIPLYNVPGFNLGVPKINPKAKVPCTIFKDWRSVHNVNPQNQRNLWKNCPQKKELEP